MYIYIYIYIYNLHLGFINAAPPLFVVFPPNDLFTIHLLSKGRKYTKLWPRLY